MKVEDWKWFNPKMLLTLIGLEILEIHKKYDYIDIESIY